MQIVGYRDALVSGYSAQMLESVNMIYKIALDAENAFWDTLKQQCDARIYTVAPDLVAQDILSTLPHHLNYFMERFALMVDEPFEPIENFSDGTSPFYVRRGFVLDEHDPLEELVPVEAVQSIVEEGETPELVPSTLPLKGYMDYVPFGEAVIQLLFGITHTIRGWLQNHDTRASSPLIHGMSMKMLYDQVYTLMSNSVSTNFAGVATPRYISQYNDDEPEEDEILPAFLPGFMKEEIPYYCRVRNFDVKAGFYECHIFVNEASGMLDSIFADNWVFIEKFESKDEFSEFLDRSVFRADDAEGYSGATMKLRPTLTGTDLEYFRFFMEYLREGAQMNTTITRTPGEGYVLRDIGKVEMVDKGEEPVE